MTELERLQEAVVDTITTADAADDAAYVAYDNYFKAKRELARYLKEQDE